MKRVETNITNRIIKNDKISAEDKISKFKDEEKDAIELENKFSASMGKLYLKEKKHFLELIV